MKSAILGYSICLALVTLLPISLTKFTRTNCLEASFQFWTDVLVIRLELNKSRACPFSDKEEQQEEGGGHERTDGRSARLWSDGLEEENQLKQDVSQL